MAPSRPGPRAPLRHCRPRHSQVIAPSRLTHDRAEVRVWRAVVAAHWRWVRAASHRHCRHLLEMRRYCTCCHAGHSSGRPAEAPAGSYRRPRRGRRARRGPGTAHHTQRAREAAPRLAARLLVLAVRVSRTIAKAHDQARAAPHPFSRTCPTLAGSSSGHLAQHSSPQHV